MKKLLIIAALTLMPLAAMAQMKFGNVNASSIMRDMPESAQALKELEDMQNNYENELSKMTEELQKKYTDYMAVRDSLPEGILAARQDEIEQLQQRIQTFRDMAARDLQQKQQQKMAPIVEKLNKAIQAVGEKNSFTYIFDLSNANIPYFSPSQCVDVDPLVKAELGIK